MSRWEDSSRGSERGGEERYKSEEKRSREKQSDSSSPVLRGHIYSHQQAEVTQMFGQDSC